MNFDNLIEDLESQFDAQLNGQTKAASITNASGIEVVFLNGERLILLAPLLGHDFVGGLVLGEQDWRFIQLSTVRQLIFIEASQNNLPLLKESPLEAIDYLEQLPLPISISWQYVNEDQVRVGQLISIHQGCLLVQLVDQIRPMAIPFAACMQVNVMPVEKLNGIFKVR